jgi:DNA-binding FadR family transcriptional regulator
MAGTAEGRRLTGRARDAVFAPLESAGRAEVVARRLTDAIALGLLRDAEQLPSEAELAASFGVSPVTVREALVVLRHRGLVRTRRGRGGGSFVTAPADPQAAAAARLRDTSLADLRDLCDHYIAVSATAALLAADRAGEEDVARIRIASRAMAGAADAGACRRAEGGFHVEVAAASQSARLTREEIALQTEVGPLLWLPYDDAAARAHAVEQHDAILRAVAAGDERAAFDLTTQHVHDMLSRVGALYLDAVDSGGPT